MRGRKSRRGVALGRVAGFSGARGRDGMQRGRAAPTEAEEILLSMGPDLNGGFRGYISLDGFPFPAVNCKRVEETFMLLIRPVLPALCQHVLLPSGLRLRLRRLRYCSALFWRRFSRRRTGVGRAEG